MANQCARYFLPHHRTRAVCFGIILAAPILLAGDMVVEAAPQRDLLENAAGRYTIKPSGVVAEFSVSQFGIGEIAGKFKSISGSLTFNPKNLLQTRVNVVIQSASAVSAEPDVTKFIRGPDFLHAKAHPVIRFKSTQVRQTGERTASVLGNLTIRKITKPVIFKVRFQRAGRLKEYKNRFVLVVNASAKFSRAAFGLKAISGIVGDTVKLNILINGFRT